MNKNVKSLLTFIEKETAINVELKGIIPTRKLIDENNTPVRIDLVSIHNGMLGLGICSSNSSKRNSLIFLKVIYCDDVYLDETIAIQNKLFDATQLPVFIDKITYNNE